MNGCALAVLGSGNAASCFVPALKKAGFRILQVFSRNFESAKLLADRVGALPITDPEELSPDTGIVLSMVKDSAAADVWSRTPFHDRLVIHTAGSLPLDALAPFTKNRGVLYPVQTLSRKKEIDFSRVPLLIEANTPENVERVRALAAALGGPVREADSRQRKGIHLAAVFANNFSNHMYFIANEIAKKNNLPFDLLLPIIQETAEKVRSLSPADAQTGPAIRYDRNVIEDHLSILADEPDFAKIYSLLTESIHRRAGK